MCICNNNNIGLKFAYGFGDESNEIPNFTVAMTNKSHIWGAAVVAGRKLLLGGSSSF